MARFDIPSADFPETAFGIAVAMPVPLGETLMERGLAAAAGRDGVTDLVAAHMWFNIADQMGVEDAAWHRGEVAQAMTKVEIGRALRQAREWLARN